MIKINLFSKFRKKLHSHSKGQLVVWCSDEIFSGSSDESVIYWSKQTNISMSKSFSIPELLDSSEEKFKDKYISFIKDLGETSIKGSSVIEKLKIKSGYSLWWSTLISEQCNSDSKSRVDDCIKLLVLEDWLSKQNYKKIVLIGADKILCDSLDLLCEGMNIDFSCASTTTRRNKFFDRSLVPSLLYPFLAFTSFFLRTISRLPLRASGLSSWSNNDYDIILTSYSANLSPEHIGVGNFHSKYWGDLVDLLRNEKLKVGFLHLFTPDKIMPSAKLFSKYLKTVNGRLDISEGHVSLDSFMNLETLIKILLEWLIHLKNGFIIKRPIKEKADFLWPLLKYDFKLSFFGSFGLNNIAFYYLTERALASLPKNCQGIYLQENQCWEYGFAHLWKMRDLGRLFGFVHVPIAYWDLMFFHHRKTYLTRKSSNPDFSIVGSLSCLSLLERQNLPIKTLPLEALRYIGFGEGRQSILLHKTFRPNNHRKVLLVLCDIQNVLTREMLAMLKDLSSKFSHQYMLKIKFHPLCHIEDIDLGDFKFEVWHDDISSALQASDIVFTSNGTSAAIEAYVFGLKVISMRDLKRLNLSCLKGSDEITFVSNLFEFSRALAKFQDSEVSIEPKQFFLSDKNLPRWKEFISESLQ